MLSNITTDGESNGTFSTATESVGWFGASDEVVDVVVTTAVLAIIVSVGYDSTFRRDGFLGNPDSRHFRV